MCIDYIMRGEILNLDLDSSSDSSSNFKMCDLEIFDESIFSFLKNGFEMLELAARRNH